MGGVFKRICGLVCRYLSSDKFLNFVSDSHTEPAAQDKTDCKSKPKIDDDLFYHLSGPPGQLGSAQESPCETSTATSTQKSSSPAVVAEEQLKVDQEKEIDESKDQDEEECASLTQRRSKRKAAPMRDSGVHLQHHASKLLVIA